MKSKVLGIFCVTLIIGSSDYVCGQSSKVSPKLDFDDTENKENSSMPVIPDIVKPLSGDHGGSGSSASGSEHGGKTSPKIHGVRVTVDTGDNPKPAESKESVESTNGGKHTKRVGIHTDITFEITADVGDNSNTTSSAQREDASVPIYKGRGSSTGEPFKPYDPKANWNPNFSSERRGFDNTGRSRSPAYDGQSARYPQHVPVYMGIGENRGSDGSRQRKGDGWNSYVPMSSVWTTERYHSEPYRPNTVNRYRGPSWTPCYCIGTDSRRRRDNSQGYSLFRPTSSVIDLTDGKLERPFSKK